MAEQQVERFTAWGTRALGGAGLAIALVVVALGLPGVGETYPAVAYACCALAATGIWVVMIRPAVLVDDDHLVLRNPLTTVRLPLAAVERVVVRQWLTVSAGGRQFSGSGVGRSLWQARRDDRQGDVTGGELARLSYGGVVERRIDRLAEDARARHGVERYSDEQHALAATVRREWARVEIALLAASALAVVVTSLA